MNVEKERAAIIHFLYWGVVLCVLYFFFNYVLYEILPLFIGFLIAFSLRPAIRNTAKILPFPQRLIAFFYLILFLRVFFEVINGGCRIFDVFF